MIRLVTENDVAQAVSLIAMAYPGMKLSTVETQNAFIERLRVGLEADNNLKNYGLFDE